MGIVFQIGMRLHHQLVSQGCRQSKMKYTVIHHLLEHYHHLGNLKILRQWQNFWPQTFGNLI